MAAAAPSAPTAFAAARRTSPSWSAEQRGQARQDSRRGGRPDRAHPQPRGCPPHISVLGPLAAQPGGAGSPTWRPPRRALPRPPLLRSVPISVLVCQERGQAGQDCRRRGQSAERTHGLRCHPAHLVLVHQEVSRAGQDRRRGGRGTWAHPPGLRCRPPHVPILVRGGLGQAGQERPAWRPKTGATTAFAAVHRTSRPCPCSRSARRARIAGVAAKDAERTHGLRCYPPHILVPVRQQLGQAGQDAPAWRPRAPSAPTARTAARRTSFRPCPPAARPGGPGSPTWRPASPERFHGLHCHLLHAPVYPPSASAARRARKAGVAATMAFTTSAAASRRTCRSPSTSSAARRAEGRPAWRPPGRWPSRHHGCPPHALVPVRQQRGSRGSAAASPCTRQSAWPSTETRAPGGGPPGSLSFVPCCHQSLKAADVMRSTGVGAELQSGGRRLGQARGERQPVAEEVIAIGGWTAWAAASASSASHGAGSSSWPVNSSKTSCQAGIPGLVIREIPHGHRLAVDSDLCLPALGGSPVRAEHGGQELLQRRGRRRNPDRPPRAGCRCSTSRILAQRDWPRARTFPHSGGGELNACRNA